MVDAMDMTELARTTGFDAEDLQRWTALGLLVADDEGRFGSDAAVRARLVAFAERRGISADALAEAMTDRWDLIGVFVELQQQVDRPYDIDTAAAKAELPLDLVLEVREILEIEESRVSEEDVAALQMLSQALAAGLPRQALLQLVRVFADHTDRLADAENRVFHHYVHDQLRVQGFSGQELLEATSAISKPLLELIEPALIYMHRLAFDRAAREDMLRHLIEDDLPLTPGQTNATVLFVDLAGFTPLTAAMGDESAAEVVSRFSVLVRRCAHQHGGRIVKQIGDAFMLTFLEPNDAIAFGMTVNIAAGGEDQFPALHIGAHHGPVLFREGDYVGATVNLAARVASATEAAQFLITEAVAKHAQDQRRLRELPARELKGVPDPIVLVEVDCGDPFGDTPIDPVCGMQVTRDTGLTTEHVGRHWSFCSPKCRSEFLRQPDRYLA